MKKMNLVAFYQFGFGMACLKNLKPGRTTLSDYHIAGNVLMNAQLFLEYACHKDAPLVPLKISFEAAQSLLQSITRVLQAKVLTPGQELTTTDIEAIDAAYTRFEIVFASELPKLPAFFVSPKGIFDTDMLIERADEVFSPTPDVKKRLTADCVFDIQQAGKCLAFEMSTAAGFHSARALEDVAKDYVKRRKLTVQQPVLNSYIKALKADGADAKAMQILDQIRDLRRNPIAHPGEKLALDEAITVFQLCTSAITALIQDMDQRGLFN